MLIIEKLVNIGRPLRIGPLLRACGIDTNLFLPLCNQRYQQNASRSLLLKMHGINLVLDIGAYNGSYALNLIRKGYSGRIISFEPLEKSYSQLVQCSSKYPNWSTHNIALGNRQSVECMNVSSNYVSSSLLQIEKSHTSIVEESKCKNYEQVKVFPIDHFIDAMSLNGEDRILMKIDVQGYEKAVLDGAPQFLEHVSIIEIEISTKELYKGQPLAPEIISYLDEKGFYLAGIHNQWINPKTVELLQFDAIFLRKNEIKR